MMELWRIHSTAEGMPGRMHPSMAALPFWACLCGGCAAGQGEQAGMGFQGLWASVGIGVLCAGCKSVGCGGNARWPWLRGSMLKPWPC